MNTSGFLFSRRVPQRWAMVCGALLWLMGGVLPGAAQPSTSGDFSLVRLDASARAAALGGAFTAVDDGDVTSLFYNPALLSAETHRRASLSYLNHVSDLNAGFLASAYHAEGLGTVGAGLRFLSWGQIEGANEVGERVRYQAEARADIARSWGGRQQIVGRRRRGPAVRRIAQAAGTTPAMAPPRWA